MNILDLQKECCGVWSMRSYKCPRCDGTGLIMKLTNVSECGGIYTDNRTGAYTCNMCGGNGTLWSHECDSGTEKLGLYTDAST